MVRKEDILGEKSVSDNRCRHLEEENTDNQIGDGVECACHVVQGADDIISQTLSKDLVGQEVPWITALEEDDKGKGNAVYCVQACGNVDDVTVPLLIDDPKEENGKRYLEEHTRPGIQAQGDNNDLPRLVLKRRRSW